MRGYITDPGAERGLGLASDLPEPDPAADELILEVRAFAINRGELHLLQSRTDGWQPGQDIAGVVARAAADGSGPPAGTRVVAIADGGGWSERVALPTRHVAPLPDEVSFEAAASLPIAGLTALRALRIGGGVLGRSVLVTGATGGVGQFAVQLARAAGARVVAQVSSVQRQEHALALGAHETVVGLDDERLGPFHLVLDGVGGMVLKEAVHRMAPGATAVTYGTLGGPAELSLADFGQAQNGKVMGFFHMHPEAEKGRDLAILAELVAAGQLDPLLGSVSDWEQLPDVLDALRDRRIRGKAVLTVG
jgi:NADPH2:quinone reductase